MKRRVVSVGFWLSVIVLAISFVFYSCKKDNNENNIDGSASLTIQSFTFIYEMKHYTAIVNNEEGTISAPAGFWFSASNDSITPTIVLEDEDNSTISPESEEKISVSSKVTYTVSDNNSNLKKTYTLDFSDKNTSQSIKSFTFTYDGSSYEAIVDNEEGTISAPAGFWFSASNDSITPTIVLGDEDNNIISPESGEKISISSEVTYTITNKNNSNIAKTYTLNFSDRNEALIIKSFTFTYDSKLDTAIVDNEAGTISAPAGFWFSASNDTILPTIVLEDEDNSTISPGSGQEINVSSKVTYTVRDNNSNLEKTYTLDFSNKEYAPAIESFTFDYDGSSYTAIVDNERGTISAPADFAFITSNDTILPTIVFEDEDNNIISPESGEKISISSEVTYTITNKKNGNLKKTYTLDFTDKNESLNIESFTFGYDGSSYTAIVDNEQGTISPPANFWFIESNDAIVPTIELKDAVSSTISPESGDEVNVSSEVTYTVADKNDGTLTKTYTLDFSDKKYALDIESFTFDYEGNNYTAIINNGQGTISAPADFGFITSNDSIAPTIVLRDGNNSTISPKSGEKISISSEVTYTVRDNNNSNSTRTYTLDFTDKNESLNIESFTFGYDGSSYTAIVDNEQGTISPPAGFEFLRDNDAIVPTIVLKDAVSSTISPGSGEEINVSSAVTYTVTDKNDGSLAKTYTLDFRDAEALYGLADKDVVLYEDFSEMPTVSYDEGDPEYDVRKPTGVVEKDGRKVFIFHSAGQLYVPLTIGKRSNEEVGAYYTRGNDKKGTGKSKSHTFLWDNDWDEANGVTYKITIECETGIVPGAPNWSYDNKGVHLYISFSEYYREDNIKTGSDVVDPKNGNSVKAVDDAIKTTVDYKDSGKQTIEITDIKSEHIRDLDAAKKNLLIYAVNGSGTSVHWGHRNNFIIYSIKIEKQQQP